MSSSRAQSSKSSGSSSSPNEPSSQASPAPESSSPAQTDMDQTSAPTLPTDVPTVPPDSPILDSTSPETPQTPSEATPGNAATSTTANSPLTPPKPPKPPVRPVAVAPSEAEHKSGSKPDGKSGSKPDSKPQVIKPAAPAPTEPVAKPAPTLVTAAAPPQDATTETEADAKAESAESSESSESAVAYKNASRQHPIPPASEPMQYRAIGLVRGVYTPSEEQFTRGTLVTEDGTVIDAVLLGRVMSLVKKHLDLTQAHLWVVYPRTREKVIDLHAQIVGVWEPESLTKETEDGDAADSEAQPVSAADRLNDGYFSVRGEVLSASPDENRVIVRVQQAPKKSDKPGEDRERMFKIILHGSIEGKTVGYFWDLHVQRQGNDLTLQSGTMIGLVPPKKRKAGAGAPRGNFARKKRFPDRGGAPVRPVRAGEGSAPAPVRREGASVSKPVKRPKES